MSQFNIKLSFLLFIAFILLGCNSSNSPKLSALNNNDVILAFGDSLTKGVGVKAQNSYPSVLAELTGLDVINSGVSGETTHGGLKRFRQTIIEHNPSLVILLEGGNDILRNISHAQIEKNLEQMIGIAQSLKVQIVLIGVPEKSLFSDSAPFYNILAEKFNLVFNAELISNLMRTPSMKSDSIHFNKEGYALMAKEIYELLLESGAFESSD